MAREGNKFAIKGWAPFTPYTEQAPLPQGIRKGPVLQNSPGLPTTQ